MNNNFLRNAFVVGNLLGSLYNSNDPRTSAFDRLSSQLEASQDQQQEIRLNQMERNIGIDNRLRADQTTLTYRPR